MLEFHVFNHHIAADVDAASADCAMAGLHNTYAG